MKEQTPQLYQGELKELSIDMKMDWRNEMKIHLSDTYLEHLYALREEETACYFCGFIDGRFMEIHHLNGDHNDFKRDNAVPCCTLCHRVQHIGWIGVKNHGRLVYIPNNIKNVSEEIAPSVAAFNQMQRFFMLRDYYDDNLKNSIEKSTLFISLEDTVLNNKRIIMGESYKEYLAKKEELRLKAIEAGFSDEEQKVKEKDAITGDDAVTQSLDISQSSEVYEASIESEDGSENPLSLASGSLLDVVVSLGDIHNEYTGPSSKNPALNFIKEQRQSDHGRFMVLFNTTVFEPFEPYPAYDFYERINYYLSLDQFNPAKMGFVLEKQLTERK